MAKDPMQETLEGTVSGMQQRVEPRAGGPVLVWNFRLERFAPGREPLPRVSVEMRGRTFSGSIANGDVVRVLGRADAGTVRVRRAENLTSRATVEVSDNQEAFSRFGGRAVQPRSGGRWLRVLVTLVAIAAFLYFARWWLIGLLS